MKQLYSSVAIAREYKKELKAFHKQIFNTLEYWLLAKIKSKDSLDDDIINILKEGDYIKNKENLYLGSLKINKIEKDYYLTTDENGIHYKVKKNLALRVKTPTLPYSKTDTLQTRLTKVKSNLESLSEDFGKVFVSKQIYKFIKNIDKNFKQNIGIDFKKIENDFSQEMKEKIQLIYESNMSLIKSIPRDIITSLEPALLNASIEGNQALITKTLSRLKVTSVKRINTIARDQTSKGLSAIATLRATQAGFEYYEWRTAKDERVSSGYGGHDKLNKKIFRYDTAEAIIDSYGNKGHPAQRVNCRCVGIPIFIEPNQKIVKDNLGYRIINNN